MKDLLRELYFGFIAILMFSELIASNMFSLFFDIQTPVDVMGVTEEVARQHMLTLAFFDALVAVGAVMVYITLRYVRTVTLGKVGLLLVVFGLLAYGCYQYWFAVNRLQDMEIFIKVVAGVYFCFGLGAWGLGRPLLYGDWKPEQPVELNELNDSARLFFDTISFLRNPRN
jgi:hypothetical protein